MRKECEGHTDFKETFKLNGEDSLSLLKVAAHHASLVLAASFSCEKNIMLVYGTQRHELSYTYIEKTAHAFFFFGGGENWG